MTRLYEVKTHGEPCGNNAAGAKRCSTPSTTQRATAALRTNAKPNAIDKRIDTYRRTPTAGPAQVALKLLKHITLKSSTAQLIAGSFTPSRGNTDNSTNSRKKSWNAAKDSAGYAGRELIRPSGIQTQKASPLITSHR